MDPVSIVGSIFGIIHGITTVVKIFDDLKSKYQTVSLTVSLLISQLSTLKAALGQISEWITTSLYAVSDHEQLVADLNISLEGCQILILVLDEEIHRVQPDEAVGPNFRGKLRYIWDDDKIKEYLGHLNNQTNALNLLLTALQCKSTFDQQRLLCCDASRQTIQRVSDDTSSLIWLRDAESNFSRTSTMTEDRTTLDVRFGFDSQIINTRAYQGAMRSILKQVICAEDKTESRPTWHTAGEVIVDTESGLDESDRETILRELSIPKKTEDRVRYSYERGTKSSPVSTRSAVSQQSIMSASFMTSTTSMEYKTPRCITCGALALGNIWCAQHHPCLPDILLVENREDTQVIRGGNQLQSVYETPKSRSFLTTLLRRLRNSTSGESRERTKCKQVIENQLVEERKVFLLGIHQSGNSTMLHPLEIVLEDIFSNEDRESFKESIYSKLVRDMRIILNAMERLELRLDDVDAETHVQTMFLQSLDTEIDGLSRKVASAIDVLWKDAGVQEAFRRSQGYPLSDSSAFFLSSIHRVALPDYLPTDEDIAQLYIPTSRNTEPILGTLPLSYRSFDLGGKQREPTRWIHCIENIQGILFRVDISSYDQLLWGNETVNRIQEDLELFGAICNSQWFVNSPIILLFDKMEKLGPKLLIIPLKNYFPDYNGGSDCTAACEYFKNLFIQLVNKNKARPVVHTYFISALNKAQVEAVLPLIFGNVKDSIKLLNSKNSNFYFRGQLSGVAMQRAIIDMRTSPTSIDCFLV